MFHYHSLHFMLYKRHSILWCSFSSSSNLELIGYCDADWASDFTDRHSIIGYCFLFGDFPIFWHSRKQTVIAWSNTEVEYWALADAPSELFWLLWLLEAMIVSHSSIMTLYYDNRSVIQIAHNDVFHKRTKHIENDFHFVCQHFFHGTIWLISVHSTDQTVNIFTKSHLSGKFNDLMSKLKLTSTPLPWVSGGVNMSPNKFRMLAWYPSKFEMLEKYPNKFEMLVWYPMTSQQVWNTSMISQKI